MAADDIFASLILKKNFFFIFLIGIESVDEEIKERKKRKKKKINQGWELL